MRTITKTEFLSYMLFKSTDVNTPGVYKFDEVKDFIGMYFVKTAGLDLIGDTHFYQMAAQCVYGVGFQIHQRGEVVSRETLKVAINSIVGKLDSRDAHTYTAMLETAVKFLINDYKLVPSGVAIRRNYDRVID